MTSMASSLFRTHDGGHWFFRALILISCGCCQAFSGDLPNPSMTPGQIDKRVTQENIQTTVCVKGYTKTVRPPAYFTNALKKRQIRAYGYADQNPTDYQEDHLIPLSIGGHPSDEQNLWPQPRKSEWGSDRKDQLEFVLYRLVCNGEVPLAEAQSAMAHDWIGAWKKYVPTHPKYKFHPVD